MYVDMLLGPFYGLAIMRRAVPSGCLCPGRDLSLAVRLTLSCSMALQGLTLMHWAPLAAVSVVAACFFC